MFLRIKTPGIAHVAYIFAEDGSENATGMAAQ